MFDILMKALTARQHELEAHGETLRTELGENRAEVGRIEEQQRILLRLDTDFLASFMAPPALIIPEMTEEQAETFRAIMAAESKSPRVLMTGHDREADREEASLAKPSDVTVQAVKEILQQAQGEPEGQVETVEETIDKMTWGQPGESAIEDPEPEEDEGAPAQESPPAPFDPSALTRSEAALYRRVLQAASDGHAIMSAARVASEMRCSMATFGQHVDSLEKRGAVKRVKAHATGYIKLQILNPAA